MALFWRFEWFRVFFFNMNYQDKNINNFPSFAVFGTMIAGVYISLATKTLLASRRGTKYVATLYGTVALLSSILSPTFYDA
jgi:glucan phosphoethanolaminetransferase (alkaline phosphatase superfamily)